MVFGRQLHRVHLPHHTHDTCLKIQHPLGHCGSHVGSVPCFFDPQPLCVPESQKDNEEVSICLRVFLLFRCCCKGHLSLLFFVFFSEGLKANGRKSNTGLSLAKLGFPLVGSRLGTQRREVLRAHQESCLAGEPNSVRPFRSEAWSSACRPEAVPGVS